MASNILLREKNQVHKLAILYNMEQKITKEDNKIALVKYSYLNGVSIKVFDLEKLRELERFANNLDEINEYEQSKEVILDVTMSKVLGIPGLENIPHDYFRHMPPKNYWKNIFEKKFGAKLRLLELKKEGGNKISFFYHCY